MKMLAVRQAVAEQLAADAELGKEKKSERKEKKRRRKEDLWEF